LTDTVTAPPPVRAPERGRRSAAPDAPSPGAALRTAAVAVAGLLALVVLGRCFHATLLTPPLAASAVIIAQAPGSPPAQPRSVFGGHLLSALLGFLAVAVLGVAPWTAALAGGCSLAVMALTRTVHAPAAATAALIVAQHPAPPRTAGWLMAGCAVLVLTGAAAALLSPGGRYPRYWW
jgi:CBS-domain-containing membrane protein